MLEGIRATRATPHFRPIAAPHVLVFFLAAGPILPLLARFVSGFCVARLGLPSLVASVLLGLACRARPPCLLNISLSSFRPKKASLFSFFFKRPTEPRSLFHGCSTVSHPSCRPRLLRSLTPAVVVAGRLSLAPASLFTFLGKLRFFSHHARGLQALLIF